MKLRHLLFGLLAGVAFVACTNDDDPAGVTPADGNKVASADMFMAVNLKMPSGAATRADVQTTEETAVNKVTFLFFKGDEQVADPFPVTLTNGKGTDAIGEEWTPGNGSPKAPVIVLHNPSDYPTSLVVLINYGGTVAKATKLSALQDIVADYSATNSGFVMSNSVYNDAAGNVIGAPVTSANIKNTPGEAKDAPVKVYVERVLAKVSVTKAEKVMVDTGDDNITIDPAESKWGLVYENTQSYLIKKLKKTYSYGWTWNDPTNHRSYWAEAAEFKPVDKDKATAYKDYVALGSYLYTQENTAYQSWTPKSATTNPTAVIVAATLKYTDPTVENATAEAVDLFKYYGAIYPAKGIKTILYNNSTPKYYKKDGNNLVGLVPDDFELVIDAKQGESYEAKVHLKLAPSVTTVYTSLEDQGTTAATANAELAKTPEILEYWKGGATYFYVPIKQHAAESNTDKDVFGIVRNHFYQLTITKIQGLGTAVPNPADVIIPETTKDDDYYIASEINILDWASVEQGVEF